MRGLQLRRGPFIFSALAPRPLTRFQPARRNPAGARRRATTNAGNAMLTEAIRLTLFPAMMAFAASSDLLTMTIANRVSLALIGGFAFLAALIGMSGADVLSHIGAAAAVLAVAFGCFACGWIGGGDAELAAATALWLGFSHLFDLSRLCIASWRCADRAHRAISHPADAAEFCWGTGMGRAAAPAGRRRALWHCASPQLGRC